MSVDRTSDVVADRSVSGREIDALLVDGFVVRPGVIDESDAQALGAQLLVLASEERREHGTRPIPGNGYYLRELAWKHPAFHRFVRWSETILTARALLGPRVRVALDARLVAAGSTGAGTGWHIHTPPDDSGAPWASVPHTMACLLYLDSVSESEGALEVIPGSHRRRWEPHEAQCSADAGEVVSLLPRRGDLILTHGNLWHRAAPALSSAGMRRVLFVGYGPAWMILDPAVAGQPLRLPRLVDSIDWPGATPPAQEQADLLGEFRW